MVKPAWYAIETIFQDNKRTRAISLKEELRVIQMGDQTADEYFSKIEAILTLLTNLAHKDPFPDLATVRSMVATEELRLHSRSSILPTGTTSSAPQFVFTCMILESLISLLSSGSCDWAGCPTTRRSTSCYCVFLGNNLLSWSSKRQVTLSRSSAEAEYRGVANAVAETCWLRNLLRELHTPLSTATLVYCDNVSAVYLSSNPVQHQRTKHIEIDIHFVRDLVAAGHIRVLHVPSRYQYADVFTKGLPKVLFDEFCSSLSVRSFPTQTKGGC
ncbi:ribonuclease H-like domain-containing protein [Tanacetum coccineum]